MEESEARVVDWDNEKAEGNKITKANALVEARYRLTIREQRLILMAISLLSPEDEDIPTVKIRIKDLIEVLELDSHSFYNELKKTLKRLLSRVLEIQEENGYTLLHWVEVAKYLEGEGTVELKISKELKPYLLKLREKFTTYYLKAVIGLRSSYSVRLYELLKQYQDIGRRRFSIEELRSILKIEPDEYTRYNDFKRFVILQAQRELKEKTDIYFDFREIKRGRRVAEIEFTILENPRFRALKEKEEEVKIGEEKEGLKKRYEDLLKKWEPYLKELNLRRLSKAHAVFFLENSLLEPEQTLKAIEGDDLNPMIKNPIGTLFNSLPLRSKLKDFWLLKLELVKEAPTNLGIWEGFKDWESRWEKKWNLARKVLTEHGIDFTLPKVPTNEEEAAEILSEVEKVVAKALWDRLPKEERKEIHETFKAYQDNEELFKVLVEAEVLRRFGIPSLGFYTD